MRHFPNLLFVLYFQFPRDTKKHGDGEREKERERERDRQREAVAFEFYADHEAKRKNGKWNRCHSVKCTHHRCDNVGLISVYDCLCHAKRHFSGSVAER